MPVRVRVGDFTLPRAMLLDYARSASGPIAREIRRRTTSVQTEARRRVGKRTRGLERSIVTRLAIESSGPVGYVSTSSPIAEYHHNGTRPHVIRPTRRKFLRFPGGRGVTFAKVVHHPGTKPNRFLTDSLPAARR